jgi:site-specific DNA-methyltransferase (adenine-specific)
MARKPVEGTVAENVLKHGTGGINIDGCRISTEDKTQRENKGVEWGVRNDKSGNESNVYGSTEGRFPANVMHDGLEQEWARFFYCPKVSKNERNRGLDEFEEKKTSSMSGRRDPHDMEKSKIDNDVTGRFVTKRKNVHPTVKPVELMKYLCRLVTPKGGTVLDPFMGSGSTGMAAKNEGFEFIGIEKEKEYYEIAEQRINTTSPLLEFI